jgi:1-deoxy-D-xylulose-5-phosphate reductoisomerase
MKGVCLLGSTGQIGTRVLEVLRNLPGFHVVTLAARGNVDVMARQVAEWRPDRAVLLDPDAARRLRTALNGSSARIEDGQQAMLDSIRDPAVDIVFCAIAGAQGLLASVEAVKAGKRLALANKESVVMAGPLLARIARATGAAIIPVDSEHSGVLQALGGAGAEQVRRVVLTGSGGPFRQLPAAELAGVTPAQALRHPVWEMGAKITVDSATLMNKALEIIEACSLFEIPPDKVEVVIHPQSILHAMVEFVDGSMLAQMSRPDMRLPIQYALTYPSHFAPIPLEPIDFSRLGALTFEPPDLDRFPSVSFGYEAARIGGTAGACLNGADEIAVAGFLAGRIPFLRIFEAVGRVLADHPRASDPSLEEILEADRWARRQAARFLGIGSESVPS